MPVRQLAADRAGRSEPHQDMLLGPLHLGTLCHPQPGCPEPYTGPGPAHWSKMGPGEHTCDPCRMLEAGGRPETPPKAAGVNCRLPWGCESLEGPPAGPTVLPGGCGHPGVLP